ncbi:glycosyltransferase [Oleidesulfovibrio alaskensis]|uniref:glycosyltransferase n=1 Tax=Oleidesulfovibrio alaskensis TaxID=58180 RepID=UPI0003F91304|nr:glycosyltransferase [Oleidesulfovibrio alaskensis]
MTRHTALQNNREAPVLGFVLKGYPRISETFIANEIRLLEEQGLSIRIFSMRAPRESFSHDSVRAIRAQVTYLPESMLRGLPVLLRHTLRRLLRDPAAFRRAASLWLARRKGTEKLHTWAKHFMQACCLADAAEHNGPHIGHLHAHFAHTPASVALYAAELLRIPFSFTAHAKDIYTQPPQRLKFKLDRAAFAVTCTGYNKQHLDGMGSRTPVHTVYHGIDLGLFNPAACTPPVPPPYTVMTVARFVEKKGLGIVAQALGLLRGQGLDVRWLLVGDGNAKARRKLAAQIRQAGMQDHVTMTGTLTHTQVLEQYNGVHAFALGCLLAKNGDRDGIPNVIAEAMALGVPVAATGVSGIPELIIHGRTGMLAPPDDAAALADALRPLLTDTALRQKITQAARSHVEAVFDSTKQTACLARIFADTAGHARTGAAVSGTQHSGRPTLS